MAFLLQAIYDTKDEIPTEYIKLYAERDGKWEISEITGVKTQTDVDKLNEAARRERELHKETKQKLTDWHGLKKTPTEVLELIESIPELEARAEGKGGDNEDTIQKRVEARVGKQQATFDREKKVLIDENTSLKEENGGLKKEKTVRTIHDSVRLATTKAKVIGEAMPDVLMVAENVFEVENDGKVSTRNNVGVTPGMTPEVWLSEMQKTRPHWWPASGGSGAAGSMGSAPGYSGKNPFTHEDWNMQEQSKVMGTDRELANRLMEQAGATGPGHRPPPKSK